MPCRFGLFRNVKQSQTSSSLHFWTHLLWVELCPLKRHVEILTPRTSEWDLIWISDLCRCNEVKMKPLWWAIVQLDWCPYGRGEFGPGLNEEKATWRWRHTGIRSCDDRCRNWRALAQAKENQGSSKFLNLEEARKGSPLPFKEAWPCWHLDFGLLASRTVREWIAIGLNYLVCSPLSWQP